MLSQTRNAKWFDDRPRRTKRCWQCGGCGTVEVTYALMPSDGLYDPMEDAPSDAIRATVVGSSDIFTACQEASDISRKAEAPVSFTFIDRTVTVRQADDPNVVARRWWMEEYGETPEQTRARR